MCKEYHKRMREMDVDDQVRKHHKIHEYERQEKTDQILKKKMMSGY